MGGCIRPTSPALPKKRSVDLARMPVRLGRVPGKLKDGDRQRMVPCAGGPNSTEWANDNNVSSLYLNLFIIIRVSIESNLR